MKLKLYTEECCEYCHEIIHNHLDCPACKHIYAGTSVYGCISDHLSYNDTVDCESCGAKFKLISGEPWDFDAEWELVCNV